MFDFITQHQSWAAVLIYWIFSAAVSALPEPSRYRARASRPEPSATGAAGYLWLFRFCHTAAGNLTTVFGNKLPGLKTIILGLTIPLLFAVPACATHYTVRPGSLNQADSIAYDTLQFAETAIDQARIDFQANQLPASTKPALDALIKSYDVARESWLTYRGAVSTNVPSDAYFTQLNQNLSDLAAAIQNFEEAQ